MKNYEVRMRWDKKQAERLGVTYSGCHIATQVVEAWFDRAGTFG